MHPILFKIGSFAIPAYGVLLVATFAISTWALRREAVRMDMDGDKLVDTAVMGLLFGLIGAKALLILVDLPHYWANPKDLVNTIRSAGVIYGGLAGGALGILWYIRRKKMPVWSTLDVLAPFAALGVGLGRASCLMAGCCYGIPYDGPLALHFPDHPNCDAPAGIGLFPVQPLSLINGVVLCLVLIYLLRRRSFEGQIILTWLFLYSLTRGLLEFLRGDTVRGLWFGGTLSTSQIIAVVGIILASVLYLKRRREV